ncbi:LOW QUALITY PROTEIN: hypothetical protein KUTeg_013235 [Tegillarca granosa]|uniref:TAF6 C-terminal HEAT repeat domain-containing protein n=1 Tax=Tegillarca granosa TaxID=220873 RepID=A0ABQ9ET45_TEGGR|nr:LOW QUALITY PROTEIN: hypothetical protein KUTeg_013235 [Tegillarca granosa]
MYPVLGYTIYINNKCIGIHGYRSSDPLPFRQVRDGDIYFVEDTDVNLCNIAFNGYVPKNSGDTTIKAHWLAVEGVSKVTSNSQPSQAKTNVKHEITDDLQQYYENITNAILGLDNKAMNIALADLRSNPQIVPLLPYFVNFVSNGVKTVSHDISQLTKLLHTVKSLIDNTSLYLEPQPYLNLLVQGVTYCLLEPLAASINPTNDHWSLRDYAARLLAKIVDCWSSPINHLLYNTIKTLKEVFYDHNKPFCCHYGAVVGLTALGVKPLEDILIPHLPSYWPHITSVIEDGSYANMIPKADAHKVYGAILLAVELLLKCQIKRFEEEYMTDNDKVIPQEDKKDNKKSKTLDVPIKAESTSDQSTNIQNILHTTVGQFYNEMYEYFGDSLSMRLPDLNEKVSLKSKVFKPAKKEIYVKLSDSEALKSGDDLLEEFMEQVRIQEKIDKERREQEKIEKERLEKERKKREEEDKKRKEEEKKLEKIRQAKLEKERQRQQEEEQRLAKIRKEELERELKRKYEEEQERERQMVESQKKIEDEKQRKLLLQEERKRKALEKQKRAEEERKRKMLEKQRKLEEELEVEREKERQRERLMLERQREKERLLREEQELERLRKIEEEKEWQKLDEKEREIKILEKQRLIQEEKQRQETLERQLAVERQKQLELRRKSQEFSESPKHRKFELQDSSSHFRHHDLKIALKSRTVSLMWQVKQHTWIWLLNELVTKVALNLKLLVDLKLHYKKYLKKCLRISKLLLLVVSVVLAVLSGTGKKKKQNLKFTKPYDAFEFESDPEDYKPIQTFGKMQYYSSEGESSDGTGQEKATNT